MLDILFLYSSTNSPLDSFNKLWSLIDSCKGNKNIYSYCNENEFFCL